MDPVAQRIVDAAMHLAERDGYDAVRLRELANDADVALGTVYRRFSSKEDILAAALELESTRLAERLRVDPLTDPTPHARLLHFFRLATAALLRRPKLAQAMLRTISSGEPALAQKVTAYQGIITGLLVDALRGPGHAQDEVHPDQVYVAHLLQQVWFGALVGWTAGLIEPPLIVAHMDRATGIVLAGAGLDAQGTAAG